MLTCVAGGSSTVAPDARCSRSILWTGKGYLTAFADSRGLVVPDWAFVTTIPAELALIFARETGVLTFAAAGNEHQYVDDRFCIDFWIGEICPWETTTWFPCESGGVNCVGATNYSNKKRDTSYSNYGESVEYWGTGTELAGADPDTQIGAQFRSMQGTSFA